MDLKTLKEEQLAIAKQIPDVLRGRRIVETADVEGTFTNDAPVILRRKPKNQKDESTGQWVRATSKDGKYKLFQWVAYIPVMYQNEQCVIITAVPETVNILRAGLVEDAVPEIVRGNGPEDENRIEEYTLPEVIEGELRFSKVDKKYANGKTYPVKVLDA